MPHLKPGSVGGYISVWKQKGALVSAGNGRVVLAGSIIEVEDPRQVEFLKPKKTITARILELLDANPQRIWTTPDLLAELGDVKPTSFAATLNLLRTRKRFVTVRRGHYRSVLGGPVLAIPPRAAVEPILRRQRLPAKDPAPQFVPPAAPKTLPQREAYYRNLVVRACVAVQIDLRLDSGPLRDDNLDKLQRWADKMFQMGQRAALGQDIPPDAPARTPQVIHQ